MQDQKLMFYQSHNRMMDKIKLFVEIQAGDNPLTKDEINLLIERFPGRYDFMKGYGNADS